MAGSYSRACTSHEFAKEDGRSVGDLLENRASRVLTMCGPQERGKGIDTQQRKRVHKQERSKIPGQRDAGVMVGDEIPLLDLRDGVAISTL